MRRILFQNLKEEEWSRRREERTESHVRDLLPPRTAIWSTVDQPDAPVPSPSFPESPLRSTRKKLREVAQLKQLCYLAIETSQEPDAQSGAFSKHRRRAE